LCNGRREAGYDYSKHEHQHRKDRGDQQFGIAAASERENPQQRVQRGDDGQMDAVNHGDNAVEPIDAVKAVGDGKHDDRQQEDQIEKHFAPAALWRDGEPPMMAEPEQTGDNEADHQRDQRLRVGVDQIDPGRRIRKPARLRQVIGEQRHRNAEDRVAQRLQPAHFEKTDLLRHRAP